MSSRDHDLVQSVAADEPAIILPASPPRRDPVEDADASFTRKRPRLDSGSNSLRAMSTDPQTPDNAAALPHEKQVEMTIRSHPPSSPVHAGDEDDSNTNGFLEDTLPAQDDLPIVIASPEQESGSPPIMLIDDDDDSPAFTVQLDAEDHFRQFPFARSGNYSQMVRELTHHVNTATNVYANLIPTISEWLEGIPDPSADLQGFYVNKAMFWDDFASLVNKLLLRRFPFGDEFDDIQVDAMFYRFLAAYVRVCSYLLLADVHLLSRPRPEEIYPLALLSHKHLRHLHTILRAEKSPLFHLLHKEYAADTRELSIRLHKDFLAANGAQNLLRFSDEAFHQVPINTQNFIATYVSQLLTVLGWSIHEFPSASSHQNRSEYYRGTLLFFHKYSGDLYDLSRTTDAGIARDLILFFSNLLSDLCLWDKDIAAELADTFLDFRDPESPTMSSSAKDAASTSHVDYRRDPVSFPALVSNAWKFKLLRKYVVKGKMDLRVMSIATMDAALVEIWREYSSIDTTCKHPVMQHLADFLLHGQVVDYIISVDSHPQLISRSGNIVGFLVVTHRWSDSQADAIWKTVSTNPDPRVVAATMTMLRGIISLMASPDHLYLCMKLHELPIERYTLDILRFLRDLTGKLIERSPPVDYSTGESNARPWNVCIRMIRDTAPSRDADKNILDLHSEANEQLRVLTNIVPPNERHAIYRECTRHIANRTKEATGSVRVIFMLASPPHSGDGFFFQQNKDLARQILDEIPAFVKMESKVEPYPYQMLVLQYRVELLALMISRAGPAIPTDLYQDLWDYVIGKYALSNDARNMAWLQLSQTLKVSSDNTFCEQLVFSYLSTLDPQFYTSGLFEFVANYNFPTTRQLITTEQGETSVLQIPGADMLWSMVLFSPKGTIEDRAARLLAARYVQVNDTEGVTLPEVEAAHVALVEKCMQEMRSASKTLRTKTLDQTSPAMDITLSDETQQENEVRFGRVLLFQKLLLEYVRQKPELNRSRRMDSKIDETDVPCGDAIKIKYQCGNDRQVVTMASDHTLEDLYRRLCHATGFTKINLFAKGQRLNITEKAAHKISETDFGGQLLVQRAEGAEVTRPLSGPVSGSSIFETTLLTYFDELFALMDSDDTISRLIYEFLSFFPARNTFADSVITNVASSESLFPPGKFFQARYSAQALQSRLREHIRSSSLNEKFLANAIRRLDEALLNSKLISDPISSFQELELAAVLINVLLEFLRERPSPDMSAGYFSDGSLLADRLVKILSVALGTNDDAAVVQDSYAVLLEASLHSRAVWEAFINNSDSTRLHQILLLTDPRQPVRMHIAMKIASVCGGDLPSTCPLTKGEVAARFWSTIWAILPEAVLHPEQSQQLLEIAEHVFRANDEYDRNENSLRLSLTQWSNLLLKHEHMGFVGREETDHVVLGFTKLLLCCIFSLKSFKKPVNAGTLMERIFRKYIFVPSQTIVSPTDTEPASRTILPVLESHTRQELYNLMLALAEDRNTYSALLHLAGGVENDEYEPVLATISVDRSMEVRSSTGYVGLYNPRAICYMNSLLTQLFMNLNFRKFMLSLEVQEASGAQKLLFETQRLFTQMQHSFRRSTDPRSFAACVRNLEQAPIDISIQMDADEFYNLLFDQWEAQLVKEEHKQQFRSFYGGQTLNQIKSKECEHVSERAEPFFAVQCDVQGKANLHESLQAFVRGDVMEGDNKYKCESCGGKFVDAVKRTCLKDVPDNLIFHLKRFEFDLNDFSRRKIYDHFEFPPSIDISVYHVDHLSDPSKPRKEDMFDLVGVLVHTGNCENGHYYSYIRERPCPAEGATPTWVEFDDSNVGSFDPADIAQKAFGGTMEEVYGRTMKNYSAYMLFYQRRTAVEEDQRQWVTTTREQALKVPVPQPLRKEVDVNNELFIREYCRFDSSHSRFVRQLHATSRTINHGTCSEDHEQETRALHIVLSHLSQIVWRQQTPDIFAETLSQLRRTVLTCSMCCNVVLKALSADEFALLNLLLRNMHPKIRAQTRTFIVDCLKFFREQEPALYGIEGTDGDMELDSTAPMEGVLATVVKRLRVTADETYMSTRGWDDYYLTLTQVVEMGHVETAVLLSHGILEFCLKLFSMHMHTSFRDEHYDLSRIMEKRKGITNRLIGFLSALLLRTDIRLPVISANQAEDRQATLDRERTRFPLTQREKQILLFWSDELKAIVILDKILELFDQTKVDYFYPGDIVKWMLESEESQIQTNLTRTIVEGIMLDPSYCDAYIRAGLAFCQACPIVENITKVIAAVSKAISSTSRAEEERVPGGEAVLDFYVGLFKAENEVLFEHKGNTFAFHHYLMNKSRLYAMPLLMHNLESVRKGTHVLLRELYGNPAEMPEETVALKWKTMRDLVADMNNRIVYEQDAGMLRSHLNPLIATCQALVQLLWFLSQNEDEEMQQYKDPNDTALVYQYQTEVEPRLRMWPVDDGAEGSEGGGFDGQSDYGSESDDADALLDIQ